MPADGGGEELAAVKEVFPGRLLGFEPAERPAPSGPEDMTAELEEADGDASDR